MEEALRAYLLANTAVNAACGGRIYSLVRSQGSALPVIVLQQASRVVQHGLKFRSDLQEYRLQVDCYATTKITASAVAALVFAALDQSTFFQAGKDVRRVSFLDERNFTESEATESTRLFRVSTDYKVIIKE